MLLYVLSLSFVQPTGGQQRQTTGTPMPLQPIQGQRLTTGGQQRQTTGTPMPFQQMEQQQYVQEASTPLLYQQTGQRQATGGQQRQVTGTPLPLNTGTGGQRQQTGSKYIAPLPTGGQRISTGVQPLPTGGQRMSTGSQPLTYVEPLPTGQRVNTGSQGQQLQPFQRLPTSGSFVEEIPRTPPTGQLAREQTGQVSRTSSRYAPVVERGKYERRARYTEYIDERGNKVKCYETLTTLGYICEE